MVALERDDKALVELPADVLVEPGDLIVCGPATGIAEFARVSRRARTAAEGR